MNILDLFVRSPGDVLFFAMILIFTQISFLMSVGLRRRYPKSRSASRYMLASGTMALAWGLLLPGLLFVMVSGRDADLILPALERAIITISIILVGWAFLTADHERWGQISNLVVLVLLAIITLGYMLTGVNQAALAGSLSFNLSVYGVAWSVVGAVLCVPGILLTLLFIRDVLDAPLKILFFAILLPGFLGTLYLTSQGMLIDNYSGPLRLSFFLGMIILPVVVYRAVINQWQQELTRLNQQQARRVTQERRRITQESQAVTSPAAPRLSPIEAQPIQLLKSMGLILDVNAPEDIPQQLILSALDTLKTDIAALLRLQDANYADISSAYDRVMARPLSGISFNLDDHPTLVNAIERREQRTLYVDRNADELRDIYTRLDIGQWGPVHFQPLVRRHEVIAVLMVGMPYAGRELSRTDSELLKGFGIIASNLLGLSYAAQEAQQLAEDRAIQAIVEGMSQDEAENVQAMSARKGMQDHLKVAREQIAGLSRQVMELKLQLDDERTRVTAMLGGTERELSISQRIVAINDEHIRLREERDRLSKRLQEAEAALTGATADSDRVLVNNMVRALEREKDNLSAERDHLQQQLQALREANVASQEDELDNILQQVTQDKQRVERERDQLSDRLDEIETQLDALGLDEGVTGLSQLIGELYHERALQKEDLQKLQSERDTLLAERNRMGERFATVKAYDEQIQMLETKIQNLAADREAAVSQRDKLRNENEELAEKINIVKEHRARVLAQASGMEIEIEDLHQEQAKLRSTVQEMVDERSYLESIYEKLLAEKSVLEVSYQQVLARLDGEQARLQKLNEEGANALQRMVNELTDERHQLELQLNEAENHLKQVDTQLSKLSGNLETAGMNGSDYQVQQPDLLVGLVQELRSPMTSMIGYVDLLLGESAGILGEMQKKFLQRVSSSISRLDAMIDDLVRVAHLDTGQFELDPRPVNVINLIEEAITAASIQFREKGLGIRMELDDNLPLLHADRDSLNQIIGQLLTNAYLVSPPDTEIRVQAQQREMHLPSDRNNPQSVIYIAIEDQGGGIMPEDLPRVFSRKYKAENPLIQGLGDTGVGMSIARTLTEAHGGKLWVDSKDGQGSIFQIALPVNPITDES